MKQICILSSILFLIFGCVTKHKTRQIEQIKEAKELNLKKDSTISLDIQKSTYDYFTNNSKQDNLLQKLGLTFTGTSNEDKAKVSLKQTSDGIDVEVQGTVAMALDQVKTEDKSITKTALINLVDSVSSSRFQQNLEEHKILEVDHSKLDKQKDEKGFTFGGYLTLAGLVCVGAVSFFLINRIKKGL